MKNFRYKQTVKHIGYVVILLLTYVIQVTPRLFAVLGTKPFPLVAVAVVIAMFEGELIGGIYGAFAGLLCDTAAFSHFGFNGFMLCVLCIGVGLLSAYLMQPHLGNCTLFVGVSIFLMRNFQFLFSYVLFGYEGIYKIYASQVLLATLLTIVVSPIFYYSIRSYAKLFETHPN